VKTQIELIAEAKAAAERQLRAIEDILVLPLREREFIVLGMSQMYLEGRISGLQDAKIPA
jgi:hypothetical protein